MTDTYLLSTDITSPTETGKPFPFLKIGEFVARGGKKIKVTSSLLDELVANFNSGKAGQDVPMDVQHRMNEAAAWIVSVYRKGDVLYAVPTWTELGKTLVGQKIYRYVSATVDLGARLLRAISLTNFPAVTGLDPVELEAQKEPGTFAWAASDLASKATVSFSNEEKDMTDKPNDEGVKKDQAAPPAAEAGAADTTAVTTSTVTMTKDTTTDAAPDPLAELSRDLRAQLLADAKEDLTELMGGIQEELTDMRQSMIAGLRADLAKEQELAEFSQAITSSGTHALPITPDELTVLLGGLPDEGRKAVMALLKAITENGTVDFSERGTSAPGATDSKQHKLDDAMAIVLEEHLAGGGTIEDFFALNADLLGDQATYDLTAYQDA